MSHDHAHTEEEGPPSEHEIMSRAMQELLEEKGILTAEEVRRRMELFEAEFPQRGARVIAHAWVDPAFKQRLLADGKAACAEWGLDLEADRLIAVENTPQVHNVIVCTLCSCYPRALLGPPPAWYKSLPYRSRAVSDPRGVLSEFGLELDDDVELRVLDSTSEIRYLVIPRRPPDTEGMSEDELATLVTRDSMIGVAEPAAPAPAAA